MKINLKYENNPSLFEDRTIITTYIEPPGSFVYGRLGINTAFKINIVAFLDFVSIKIRAE